MLQQTQVMTVVPYFERWMVRFPSLQNLAAAPLDEVLKAWEGLGYYRRARLLHECAGEIVEKHGGRVPERYETLLKLPGLGPYTAAAVASLAFNEDVLAVDGNVKRVAARLFLLPGEVAARTVQVHLGPHLLAGRAGAFNEALMELGATVCVPVKPRCGACPVSADCEAFRTGQTDAFPQPKARRKVPHVARYALVHARGGALWLRQRGPEEMLGGLWGFPLAEEAEGTALSPVHHVYTHFKITATPVLAEAPPDGEGRYVLLSELQTLALSKLDYKILAAWRAYRKPKEAHP